MRDIGELSGEVMVLNDLARTRAAMDDVEGALETHQTALPRSGQMRLPYEQARALDGIALALSPRDPVGARQHWARALNLYRDLGAFEQWEVQRRLAQTGAVVTDIGHATPRATV